MENGLEVKMAELVRVFTEHVKADERQFGELTRAFTDGISGLRQDLSGFTETINETMSGNAATDRAGILERVRILERSQQNRRWITGILVTVTIGLVLDEVLKWLHAINTR